MRLKMLALMVAAAMGGTSTLATAAQTGPRDSGARPSVVDAPPPNYSDSMARLQEATQRLRQAIQAMAEQPAGDRRNTAIREAHQALFDAQQAMIQLPPELYLDEGPKAQPNYTKAMDRLRQAAGKLRGSVQAMVEQPAGPHRNAAAREAREAILETQQAMISLPPQLRSQAGAERASATADARGTDRSNAVASGRKTFSEVDGNNDGFVSMIEAASDRDALSNFEKRDRNRDYKLSRSEWESGQAPAAGGANTGGGKPEG